MARARGPTPVEASGVGANSSACARARAIASAPASPTSSSGRIVPLAATSSAGKRPAAACSASSAITVVSPPSGSDGGRDHGQRAAVDDVAGRARAALRAAVRVQAVERVDQDDRVRRRARRAGGPGRRSRSTAWPCASAEAARLDRGRRARVSCGPLGDLLGADAGEHERAAAAPPAPASALASRRSASVLPARGAPTIVTREPLPNGVRPLDRLDRRVLGAEPEALGRERGRQILEAHAVGDLLGGRAVDRVDPDHRREPLGAARRRGAGP